MRLAKLVAQADGPYESRVAKSATLSIAEQLTEKVASAVVEFMMSRLLESPRRIVKSLRPPLELAYATRRVSFRIDELIDDDAQTATVAAVAHRSDAYRYALNFEFGWQR